MDQQNESSGAKVDTGAAASPPQSDSSNNKRTAPPLTKVLPTERMTLERQIVALRAFGAVAESNDGQPVTNEAAGVVAKMAAATIIMTNPWFVDVGFLTRSGKGFLVAPEVLAFLQAEHGIAPESAPEKLKPLFERHWAALQLIPRARVSPIEYDTARKIIGEACSATPEAIKRLDVALEYLCFVGILKKDGNQLRYLGTGAKLEVQQQQAEPEPEKENRKTPPKGLEEYTITLEGDNRRVILWAPAKVKGSELKRIQQWLSFQLMVEGE